VTANADRVDRPALELGSFGTGVGRLSAELLAAGQLAGRGPRGLGQRENHSTMFGGDFVQLLHGARNAPADFRHCP
jgi:hypothetical protein